MPLVCALGDVNTGGGTIEAIPQAYATVNGVLIATVNSWGMCPGHHDPTPFTVVQGSIHARIAGMPIAYDGCLCSCGHRLIASHQTHFSILG